jgi:hypothetical protein
VTSAGIKYVVMPDDILKKKKHLLHKGENRFFFRVCFHPFQKELPVFWERNKREAHFGFVVRFTISRSVITCTVREFNKLWVCSLQPDTQVALTNVLEGSACITKLIMNG